MFPMFQNILKNLGQIFYGKNITYHVLAIALTAIVVFSGFDWWYFTHTQYPYLAHVLWPAVIFGMIIPIFGTLALYLFAKIKQDKKLVTASWALAQAAALGWFVSSLYKSLTGRIQPNIHELTIDMSRDWNFGFLEHGIFWGWPSSHTSVAFAMSAALCALYPTNRPVRLLAPLYALYIGIGISTSIHWFSEFAAGAIIGSVVGAVVGRSFHKHSSK